MARKKHRSTVIQQISREASRLWNNGRGHFSTYQQAVKEASRLFKSKRHHHPSRKHTTHKRKKTRRRVGAVNTKSRTHTDANKFRNVDIQIGGATMQHVRNATRHVKDGIKQNIDKLVIQKYHAGKKTVKRKLQRKITALKSKLRAADKILNQ